MLILFYTCYIQDTLTITAWRNVAYSISEPKKKKVEYFFQEATIRFVKCRIIFPQQGLSALPS